MQSTHNSEGLGQQLIEELIKLSNFDSEEDLENFRDTKSCILQSVSEDPSALSEIIQELQSEILEKKKAIETAKKRTLAHQDTANKKPKMLDKEKLQEMIVNLAVPVLEAINSSKQIGVVFNGDDEDEVFYQTILTNVFNISDVDKLRQLLAILQAKIDLRNSQYTSMSSLPLDTSRPSAIPDEAPLSPEQEKNIMIQQAQHSLALLAEHQSNDLEKQQAFIQTEMAKMQAMVSLDELHRYVQKMHERLESFRKPKALEVKEQPAPAIKMEDLFAEVNTLLTKLSLGMESNAAAAYRHEKMSFLEGLIGDPFLLQEAVQQLGFEVKRQEEQAELSRERALLNDEEKVAPSEEKVADFLEQPCVIHAASQRASSPSRTPQAMFSSPAVVPETPNTPAAPVIRPPSPGRP